MLVDWYSKRMLNRFRLNARETEAIQLNDARRVAILFDASEVQNIKPVKKLVSLLVSNGHKVTALGYVDLPYKSFEHMSVLHLDYFDKNQLNWYGKPKGMVIDNFLEDEYDILLDLSTKSHYPLTYLSLALSARYKVGRFRKDISIFDLEIKIKQSQCIKSLIKKVSHCLIPTEGYENKFRKDWRSLNYPI